MASHTDIRETPGEPTVTPRFRVFVVWLAALATLGVPSVARAHRMDVIAEIRPAEPAVVRIEAGYEESEPAQEAKVTLADGGGKPVAEGVTDERGVCRLPRPTAGTYTVTVDDGAGHRTSVTLVVPDEPTAAAEVHTDPPNKWLMSTAGVTAIALGVLAARRWLRKPTPPTTPSPEG